MCGAQALCSGAHNDWSSLNAHLDLDIMATKHLKISIEGSGRI